jgi:hypothetical protein
MHLWLKGTFAVLLTTEEGFKGPKSIQLVTDKFYPFTSHSAATSSLAANVVSPLGRERTRQVWHHLLEAKSGEGSDDKRTTMKHVGNNSRPRPHTLASGPSEATWPSRQNISIIKAPTSTVGANTIPTYQSRRSFHLRLDSMQCGFDGQILSSRYSLRTRSELSFSRALRLQRTWKAAALDQLNW